MIANQRRKLQTESIMNNYFPHPMAVKIANAEVLKLRSAPGMLLNVPSQKDLECLRASRNPVLGRKYK